MSTKKNTPMSKADEIALIEQLASAPCDEPTYFCDTFGNAQCAGTDAAIMIENIRNDHPILMGTEVTNKADRLERELTETKKRLTELVDKYFEAGREIDRLKRELKGVTIGRHQIIRDTLIQWPEQPVIAALVGVKERAEIKIENALPLSMDETNYLLHLVEKDQRIDQEISDELAKLTE